jgi:hypothetical protein
LTERYHLSFSTNSLSKNFTKNLKHLASPTIQTSIHLCFQRNIQTGTPRALLLSNSVGLIESTQVKPLHQHAKNFELDSVGKFYSFRSLPQPFATRNSKILFITYRYK